MPGIAEWEEQGGEVEREVWQADDFEVSEGKEYEGEEERLPFQVVATTAIADTSKAGTTTLDVPLPDDVDETTRKLERSFEAAALEGLKKVQALILRELRALPEANKATGAKQDEPVPLADDDELWQEAEKILGEILLPEVTGSAQAGAQSAQDALSQVALAVDMAKVNEPVLKWSGQYTYDLVSGINDTTRKSLREAITTWQAQGLGKRGLPDLIKAIEPLFGKQRAELVASTEVTRCFSEGNVLVYKGVPGAVGEKWRTARDELVCEHICLPLNNKWVKFDEAFNELLDPKVGDKLKTFMRPPAHPRCRCRTTLVLSPAE